MDKKLVAINNQYQIKVSKFHDLWQESRGTLPLINGFEDYNNIIKLNSVWSKRPSFMPVDRTLSTVTPFNQWIPRPWQPPTEKLTLDQAMYLRATQIASCGQKINILWSGGIDSTALLVAFLSHVDHQQLRIIYSPWSTYEHSELTKYLLDTKLVEMVDVSGTVYLNWEFDGVFVSGDSGDEMMASIDSSFLEATGSEILQQPWQDFVYKQTNDNNLIEFCQKHFLQSGRDINTVLEARWWFYACFKVRSILNQKLEILFDYDTVDVSRLIGFYDCEEYERYIFWNIDHCISDSNYRSWKQVLKDYAHKFKKFDRWYYSAMKNHSVQLNTYMTKKIALNQQHWIALFDDGSVLTTPSLPMLVKKEYLKQPNAQWIFKHEHI